MVTPIRGAEDAAPPDVEGRPSDDSTGLVADVVVYEADGPSDALESPSSRPMEADEAHSLDQRRDGLTGDEGDGRVC